MTNSTLPSLIRVIIVPKGYLPCDRIIMHPYLTVDPLVKHELLVEQIQSVIDGDGSRPVILGNQLLARITRRIPVRIK